MSIPGSHTMTTKPWRQEVVDAAVAISTSLITSLTYAGSRGTKAIGDGKVDDCLKTVDSLLSRGHGEWDAWFQQRISRPLAIAFAVPEAGLPCKTLRVGATKDEVKEWEDQVKTHRDKLWAPFNAALEALDFFVRDFPRGLGPPKDDSSRSDDGEASGKSGGKHLGIEQLMDRHLNLKNAGSGPCAVLRVLLMDPHKRWSQRGMAKSSDLRDALPNEGASPTAVGRWLALLVAERLAQFQGEGCKKRWLAGPACSRTA